MMPVMFLLKTSPLWRMWRWGLTVTSWRSDGSHPPEKWPRNLCWSGGLGMMWTGRGRADAPQKASLKVRFWTGRVKKISERFVNTATLMVMRRRRIWTQHYIVKGSSSRVSLGWETSPLEAFLTWEYLLQVTWTGLFATTYPCIQSTLLDWSENLSPHKPSWSKEVSHLMSTDTEGESCLSPQRGDMCVLHSRSE